MVRHFHLFYLMLISELERSIYFVNFCISLKVKHGMKRMKLFIILNTSEQEQIA